MYQAKRTIALTCIFALIAYISCISSDGVVFYDNATPQELTFGPYSVSPNEMYKDNDFLPLSVSGLDNGLVGFTIELVNTAGDAVDQGYAYLHHFEVVDSMSVNEACPEQQSNLIVAAGADLGNIFLQIPYYIIIPGQLSSRWQYTAHVVNPNSFEVTVSIRCVFYYIKTDQSNVAVTPLFTSVGGCKISEWSIQGKENSTYYRYLEYESTVGGEIIWSTGHVHRGGQGLYLLDPNSGAVYINSLAHYNNPDHSDWITYIDVVYPNVNVKVNQSLLIGCTYDGSQDIDGAMGYLLSYVVVEQFYSGNQEDREKVGVNVPHGSSSSWSIWSILLVIFLCLFCLVSGIGSVALPLVGYHFYKKSQQRKPRFSRLSDEMEGMDDISMF